MDIEPEEMIAALEAAYQIGFGQGHANGASGLDLWCGPESAIPALARNNLLGEVARRIVLGDDHGDA
jgi:hypothetical protein